MFDTLFKILSLILYKNKVTQNKIKATSHKNLQRHKKEKNLTDFSAPLYG